LIEVVFHAGDQRRRRFIPGSCCRQCSPQDVAYRAGATELRAAIAFGNKSLLAAIFRVCGAACGLQQQCGVTNQRVIENESMGMEFRRIKRACAHRRIGKRVAHPTFCSDIGRQLRSSLGGFDR
jgi:hypothetical protein